MILKQTFKKDSSSQEEFIKEAKRLPPSKYPYLKEEGYLLSSYSNSWKLDNIITIEKLNDNKNELGQLCNTAVKAEIIQIEESKHSYSFLLKILK